MTITHIMLLHVGRVINAIINYVKALREECATFLAEKKQTYAEHRWVRDRMGQLLKENANAESLLRIDGQIILRAKYS